MDETTFCTSRHVQMAQLSVAYGTVLSEELGFLSSNRRYVMSLDDLPQLAEHPTSELYAAMARDPNPHRIDLGIGVYRDSAGQAPLMHCVREAQRRLIMRETTKQYRTPLGHAEYCRRVETLILGKDHPVLTEHRVRSAQTPGAGGALRVAAELIRLMPLKPKLWLPDPTWDQHEMIFESAGLHP